MTLDMNDDNITSITQLISVVNLYNDSTLLHLKNLESINEKYRWISGLLTMFRYFSECKKHKSIIRKYITNITQYDGAHLDRLIKQKRDTGKIVVRVRTQPLFTKIYQAKDISLLLDVDNVTGRRNGFALKKTFHDMN
jgi:hypothetical protein